MSNQPWVGFGSFLDFPPSIAPCFCSWTVLFKFHAPYCTVTLVCFRIAKSIIFGVRYSFSMHICFGRTHFKVLENDKPPSQQPNQIVPFVVAKFTNLMFATMLTSGTKTDQQESMKWNPDTPYHDDFPKNKSRTPGFFFKVNLPWKKHKGENSEKT